MCHALHAFADESFREAPEGGFYVVAAAVLRQGTEDDARHSLREIRGSRRTPGKLHWNEMDRSERRSTAKTLADVDALHLVVVGAPVPQRRQERARSMCPRKLVEELHGYEVEHLVMESRTVQLNRRDVDTVSGARFALPRGTRFRVEHVPGPAEPLLWAADVVAGAVRESKGGNSEYYTLLSKRVYEIQIDTGC